MKSDRLPVLPEKLAARGPRAAAGCIALFAAPFFLAGGVSIYLGLRELKNGGEVAKWLAPLAFGFVFASFAAAMVIGTITAVRRGLAGIAMRQQNPEHPWLWRKEWADGIMLDRLASRSIFFITFACLWNAVSLPVLFLVRKPLATAYYTVAIALVFPLVGAFLLVTAAYQLLRRQKYGVSRCTVDRIPAEPGREMRGEIETRMVDAAPEGFLLKLSCIRRVTTGSGKNRSTAEAVVWRGEQTVSPASVVRSPVGTRIPFTIAIPPDAHPTDERNTDDAIVWRLHVSAEVPGIDFAAEFELPVFNSGDAPSAVRHFAFEDAKAASWVPEPGSQVSVSPAPEGGERFVVRPRRRFAELAGLVIFATVWFGVVALMVRLKAPIVFPIVFSAFGLIVVFAIVDGLVGTSVIRASRTVITSRHEWFGGLGFAQTLDAAAIESILANVAVTTVGANGAPYYSIDVTLRDGKTRRLAGAIRERSDAEMLAARLRLATGAGEITEKTD